MEVKLKKINVRDLTKGYQDFAEDGVTGFNGKLDIRPPFQREFVYNDKQRSAVIDTVTKGFPLNVMYWAVRENKEKPYEIIDGQQRTISLCQYVNGDFSFQDLYFHNLKEDKKNQILDYDLTVYVCEGSESDKLDWFKTINIAGEELTNQELRNAVYHGPWVTNAKRYFSKTGCPAYQIGARYLTGTPIRQDYLETIIKWISKGNILDYMGLNQHKDNAEDLWDYFLKVIEWVEKIFPKYRAAMKNVEWGELYNEHNDKSLDSKELEKEVIKLMSDFDVKSKSGIYSYLLDGEESHLNLRSFEQPAKMTAYEIQEGICPKCGKHFEFNEMHGDHIDPWHSGGKTDAENCQMLCAKCNRRKSGI